MRRSAAGLGPPRCYSGPAGSVACPNWSMFMRVTLVTNRIMSPSGPRLSPKASLQSSGATKAVTPRATLIAQGEDFERLESFCLFEACQDFATSN